MDPKPQVLAPKPCKNTKSFLGKRFYVFKCDLILFSLFMFILTAAATIQMSQSKYGELLAVIEEIGKDIRPTYAGSKNASERLKKGE